MAALGCMVTKLVDENEVGLAMGGWLLPIASGSSAGAHGAMVAAYINQYQGAYMQLFWIGLIFGAVYWCSHRRSTS